MADDLEEYARTRSPALRDALVERHLPLAKFVARRMKSSLPDHIELDDLVAWASIGLLDAIDKFDPARGFKFSTYAVTRIRGAVLDGLQHMDWAPKQVTSRVWRLRKVQETLTNQLGREPTITEMAVAAGLSDGEVRQSLLDDRTTKVVSGFETVYEGETSTWERADERDWEGALAGEVIELRHRLSQAVTDLGPRESAVLTLYYRDGLNLRQIAEALGVSATSAIQTHTQLIEKIRLRLAVMGGIVN